MFTEALAKKKKFFWWSQWETHGYDVGGGKANHIALAFKWIYQPEEMEEASKTNGREGSGFAWCGWVVRVVMHVMSMSLK